MILRKRILFHRGFRRSGLISAITWTVLLTGCASPPQAAPKLAFPADLVILNARVWTGTADRKLNDREPTAIAVRHDRIVAVTDDEDVQQQIGPDTRVIDARKRRVLPGFSDAHTHVVSGGFQLVRLNLRGTADRDEFIRAIGKEARGKKPGQWVLGGRWSTESWPNPQSPHRSWIDPVTGDIPVFLSRMDGHSALVNSAALTLAGIDASGPPDPHGGEIERDPDTGEATGILKEAAMGLVSRLIPEPTLEDRYAALRRAMRHANELGISSVHDMCSLADLPAFRKAEEDGELTFRITAYLTVSDWQSYADRIPEYGLNSDMLRLAGFKGYMDGSLGSRTAYMSRPYDDAPPDSPYPRGQLAAMADPPESFRERVAMADEKGLQLAVHAIGDEANRLLLDAYEYARNRNDQTDARGPYSPYTADRANGVPRHRVEHTQHLHVEDIPRFAKLGVVASMQPFHKADDGRYAEQRLGRERLAGSYAFRQLVEGGAIVAFGSDWPVVTMNPFAGVDAAVNARTLDGRVWLPEHSLTVEEAVRAYTVVPPHAVHMEDRLGTIQPGKYADLIILAEDPFPMPKERVGDITVTHTIVGGRVVFVREP